MSLNDILFRYTTSGATDETAAQDKLSGGVKASYQMAKTDLPRLKKFSADFIAVGQKHNLPPALLAAISSRETRGGGQLNKSGYGSNGADFGLMQVNKDSHTLVGGAFSRAHINQAAGILKKFVLEVKKKHPSWSPEEQLRGGVAAYNFGVSNVRTLEGIDRGTANNDYSSDVWARAQALAPDFGGTSVAVHSAQTAVQPTPKVVQPAPKVVQPAPKVVQRTPQPSDGQPTVAPSLVSVKLGASLLSLGHHGPGVKELQRLLDLPESEQDGDFGPKTRAAVCSFQRSHGLADDGVVGPQTWKLLNAQTSSNGSGSNLHLHMGARGELVQTLQLRLESLGYEVGQTDGVYGSKTLNAVKAFQRSSGLAVDGVVGPKTWKKLGLEMKFPVSQGTSTQLPPNKTATPPKKSSTASQELPPVLPGEPSWLSVARGEYGQKQIKGSEHNPRIIEYHATTSYKAKKDEVFWCSSFVNWCMTQAGLKGTNDAGAASWLAWGSACNARYGAIAVIHNPNNKTMTSTGNHVGFLLDETATHYKLLGGNQGKQVKVSSYSKSQWSLKGYRWPSGVDHQSVSNAQVPVVSQGSHNGSGSTVTAGAKNNTAASGKKSVSIKFGPDANRAVVSKYTLEILEDILRSANVSSATITSTARTPADQARVMYNNIEMHGVANQKALYRPPGQAVIDTYSLAKANKKSREQIIQAMLEKIVELGPQTVSRHIADPKLLNVIDIGPKSMPKTLWKDFEKVVYAHPLVSKFLTPSKDKDPAFHLEIPQPRRSTTS